MKNIKVVFMGTPSFAVPVLEKLIENYNVIMVVCQPDRAKDKKGNIIYPPIKELALKNNIEVYQPLKLSSEYEYIIEKCKEKIVKVETGVFGAKMKVSLINDGPTTIIMEK